MADCATNVPLIGRWHGTTSASHSASKGARMNKRSNIRRSNGHRRSQLLAWLRSLDTPCWICGLDIDPHIQAGHPFALECDELVPASEGGNVLDRSNVARAHRCCNNWRSNRSVSRVEHIRAQVSTMFGSWSDPLDFVQKAKMAARNKDAATNEAPVRTTTTW